MNIAFLWILASSVVVLERFRASLSCSTRVHTLRHGNRHLAHHDFTDNFEWFNPNTNISFPEMPFKVSFANCRPFPLKYHRAEPVSIAQLQWNSIRGLDPLGTLSQWRHHFSILWHFYQGTASLISVTGLLQWSKFTRNFTKIQIIRKISFANSYFHSYTIILKLCTEHGSITAVLCA